MQMIDDGPIHHPMIFIFILGAGLEDCLLFNATPPPLLGWLLRKQKHKLDEKEHPSKDSPTVSQILYLPTLTPWCSHPFINGA
jgi:hypothetical protein